MLVKPNKLKYLNVGCGSKYHKDWTNVDMDSDSPDVISCNLLKRIPFPDQTFEVVYHSNILEHIAAEKAPAFMAECYRVLKTNGIIRVIAPDLENLVDEYKRCLHEVLKNPNKEAEANYDWMMIELYDQAVREDPGGQMVKFYSQEIMANEQYVIDRVGYTASSVREKVRLGTFEETLIEKFKRLGLRRSSGVALRKIARWVFGKKYSIGDLRMQGEIHMWMYDKYSLPRLFKKVGFRDITIKNPYESDIPNWGFYELDVRNGVPYDRHSLFIEAKK